MSSKLKLVLPFALLLAGVIATLVIVRLRPEVETEEAPPAVPLVRVVEAVPGLVSLDVESQGTVAASTETTLVAEVAAKVVGLAPSFAAGGFFSRGEVLVRLDRRDFELAVTRARAEVARAEVLLARERAEAELALEEWQELGGGAPPPLVAREPQQAEARAARAGAEAALARAELDLERTLVRAPFDGRVRDKRVDVGQFVAPGQPLGSVYGIDYAEVSLPVPDDQLAYLDLPLGREGSAASGPEVVLRADYAGRRHAWRGRIVRTAGIIDPASRMLALIARVDDPYARGDDGERPPLAVGLFVEAEIDGRDVRAVTLPREVLRGGDRVLVLDGDRLRFRDVEVLRRRGDRVLISAGLAAGERVCVSPLEAPVDGMRVRVTGESAP